MAALIATRPGCAPGLCYTTRTHHARKDERKSFAEHHYIALPDSVHQQLRAPLILVWDRLSTHISATMRDLIAQRAWLTVFLLTGHAPDLNPVEGVWSQVKRSLANLGAGSPDRLEALVRNRLKRVVQATVCCPSCSIIIVSAIAFITTYVVPSGPRSARRFSCSAAVNWATRIGGQNEIFLTLSISSWQEYGHACILI
jgi:DDE superfamily endonuclease